ncbi:MAG: hypothetical protein KGI50_05830 [Patescibacteria group bacterium]|nr:hypothetical protein [Patescibacteria group bacterium]MDE2438796.1 hypothetical protein [Patescibacteria group bacterium]
MIYLDFEMSGLNYLGFTIMSLIGKTVRIKEDNSNSHPIEERTLKAGDLLVVDFEDCAFVGFKSPKNNSTVFGPNTIAIFASRVELVPGVGTPGVGTPNECLCKSLLFGHEFGCPMFKSY